MTEEIKARVELVRKGKLPEGYVKTKIGIIPHQWDVKPLGMISKPIKEKAGDKKLETLSISAGIGFVNQAEKFGKELSGAQYVNYTVINKGDFSYNKGNSKKYQQGCIYMLVEREIAAVPSVFNSFRIERQNAEYYKQLFGYGILSHQLYRYINSGVRNDGLLNLYDSDFYSCELPVPSLSEQQKIAEILSTCDRLIALKKELISKKERQKKWLIHKLLERKSHWEVIKIRDLADVCSGATPSTKETELWNGDIRWMNSGELNLKRVYEVEGRISDTGLNNSGTKLLPVNCVLVGLAGQGKTRGTVAINCVELCTNQSIAAIIPNEKFISDFLFWTLEDRYTELRKISSGDGARGGLTLDLIKSLKVYLPTLEEQTAIANILSKSDEELALLNRELAELQRKKKALMQLLLTGIVRVN